VKNFYAELTDEDKAILKEIAANHESYETEDQALEALKAKSEKLYNKANDLRTLVKNKIDSLNPEAKTFVTNVSLALVISKE
jgi:TRAP-type C4-dicarboxylate transport system substrate-binding protein